MEDKKKRIETMRNGVQGRIGKRNKKGRRIEKELHEINREKGKTTENEVKEMLGTRLNCKRERERGDKRYKKPGSGCDIEEGMG